MMNDTQKRAIIGGYEAGVKPAQLAAQLGLSVVGLHLYKYKYKYKYKLINELNLFMI